MSRIPYPDPETLSPAKREALALFGEKTLNVSRMSMHAPEKHWAAQRALGFASLQTTTVEPRLRELVILGVAYLSGSDYEAYHHESLAAKAGIAEAECAALKAGDVSGFSPLEQDVCRFVTELVLHVSPSDATLAAVRARMPDERMFEIVLIVGAYMLTARVAAVGGVEMENEPIGAWL
jgi:4-carboxymuconolactone decarboxylase